MEIRRISDQGSPLEDHFADLAASGEGTGCSVIGRRMLELIARLRTIAGPPIWAVTSHDSVNLVAGDDYRLHSLVSFRYSGEWFEVSYLLRADEAPRPGSRVRSKTDDPAVACEMVAFGLSKATGVPHSVDA